MTKHRTYRWTAITATLTSWVIATTLIPTTPHPQPTPNTNQPTHTPTPTQQ